MVNQQKIIARRKLTVSQKKRVKENEVKLELYRIVRNGPVVELMETEQNSGLQSNVWTIYVVIGLFGVIRQCATNMLRN